MGSKSLEELAEQVRLAHWQEADKIIQAEIKHFSKSEIKKVLYDGEYWESVAEKAGLTSWIKEKIAFALISSNMAKADSILKDSTNSLIKNIVIVRGYYSDVSLLDYVARNDTGENQVTAAQFCSIDALRALKNAKNPKVRKIVFQRLGPVECLDEMLSDKIADIRADGVQLSPIGYSKLNDMTKEIARVPFSLLVDKISPEYLPMLLANRNLQNKWISNKIKNRLDVEGS